MTTTIYEVYNDTTIIQFVTLEEAQEYINLNSDQNYQLREIQVNTTNVNKSEPNWLEFEQYLYKSHLFQKLFGLIGSANLTNNIIFLFSFFCKVITDGKTTGASENALYLAMSNLLTELSKIDNFITEEDKQFINTLLEACGFTIRVS